MAGTCQESKQTYSVTAGERIEAKRLVTVSGMLATGAAGEALLGVSDTAADAGSPLLVVAAGKIPIQFAATAGDLSKLEAAADGKVVAASTGTVIGYLDPESSPPSADDDYATVILALATA